MVKLLGELGSTYGGLTGKTKSDFGNGSARYITFMNVMSNVVIDCESFERVQVSPEESQNRVRKGDLFLNGSSETPEEVAMCSVLLGDVRDVYLNSFCFGFRLYEGAEADGVFLAYHLRSREGRELMKSLAQGSTRYNLSKVALLKSPLRLPKLPEQRAIATALSDVDGMLGGLDRLIAKKRDLKQAAMQQLLTGQTRLPGFHGEWEVRRLGDSVQIEKGQLITRKTLLPGEIPVIAGGKEPAYHHAVANRTGRTITVSASGANAGYVALYNEPIFASDCSTISESERYCLDFVYYHLLHLQQDIYELQTGGAQPHIHANDLKPIPFPFPNLIEQTAIAGVLSDLDAEVDALEARREKTQALKQGMMQELLTGKIRLLQPEVLHA
jgi:restriction endonuclease S subunit